MGVPGPLRNSDKERGFYGTRADFRMRHIALSVFMAFLSGCGGLSSRDELGSGVPPSMSERHAGEAASAHVVAVRKEIAGKVDNGIEAASGIESANGELTDAPGLAEGVHSRDAREIGNSVVSDSETSLTEAVDGSGEVARARVDSRRRLAEWKQRYRRAQGVGGAPARLESRSGARAVPRTLTPRG